MSSEAPFTKDNLGNYLGALAKEFRKLNGEAMPAEYLIAMKLMSGRRYKNDLSDIAGILWEHQKSGNPITQDAVDKAVKTLYGGWSDIPETSKTLMKAAYADGDYENLFIQNRESEAQSKTSYSTLTRIIPVR